MYIIFFLTLIFSLNIYAQPYFFKGQKLETIKYKEHAIISANCKNECIAKDVLSYVMIPKDMGPSHIGNPSIKLCSSLPETQIGKFSSKHSEKYFCVFKDSSFVDVGGLYYYARENTEE